MKVLFLCTGNSCRSQMAEGLLRWLGGGVVEVVSAGTQPKPLHPDAVRSMREIGLDISKQRSKPVDPFLHMPFDYVVTLCDSAQEICPNVPGAAKRIHWSLPDPAAINGPDTVRLQAFREVREQLSVHIEELLADILEEYLARLAAQTDLSQADALQPEPL
jgi:arsenate reductase (thioredoxin)